MSARASVEQGSIWYDEVMNLNVANKQRDLTSHPVYTHLNSLDNIRTFMKYHVFAVWDFMSLLKSLQKHLTCTEVPWRDSIYPSHVVRFINEIVVEEESDVAENGEVVSHFQLYLGAMDEIQADSSLVKTFLENYDFSPLPKDIREVTSFHLDLAMTGKAHQVAASFFYGREKLIPDMFHSIVRTLEVSGVQCPTLVYYLKRHIELDGEDHGPKAKKCLQAIIQNEQQEQEALSVAIDSLAMRTKLWDYILKEIQA